jgi:hypothetical protein
MKNSFPVLVFVVFMSFSLPGMFVMECPDRMRQKPSVLNSWILAYGGGAFLLGFENRFLVHRHAGMSAPLNRLDNVDVVYSIRQ